MTDTDRTRRIARQHLETSRLLGVNFIPVRGDVPEPVVAEAVEAELDAVQVAGPAAGSVELFAAADGPVPPSVSADQKQRALDELKARHESTCPHCTKVTNIRNLVFGEGDANAQLMFVGEAPGEEEDRTGRPFVGRAGKKLDDIIKAMGLTRESVYIANVLKSRPPENRTPQEHEVELCGPYLAEQIRIIRPQVLVALGGPASKCLLRTTLGITRLRGSWGVYADGGLAIPLMPTFHPAYLLRQYTRENREMVWSDMQAVLARLAGNSAA